MPEQKVETLRDVIDADIVDAKHCDPIRPSDALSIFSRLSEYLDWRVVRVPAHESIAQAVIDILMTRGDPPLGPVTIAIAPPPVDEVEAESSTDKDARIAELEARLRLARQHLEAVYQRGDYVRNRAETGIEDIDAALKGEE